jgi:hypothetical protein
MIENTEKKWLKALSKTHSKHSQQVSRLLKVINKNVEIVQKRGEDLKKCNGFINKLLSEKRVTKEELYQYFTKK